MTFPVVPSGDGVTRQVLSENEALMVVCFSFEADGVGSLHNHPHVQSTYVESGRFKFQVGDEEFDLRAGDSLIVPSNAVHGCVCVEPGKLIDTFTPRRNDFL